MADLNNSKREVLQEAAHQPLETQHTGSSCSLQIVEIDRFAGRFSKLGDLVLKNTQEKCDSFSLTTKINAQ